MYNKGLKKWCCIYLTEHYAISKNVKYEVDNIKKSIQVWYSGKSKK